MVKKEKKIEYLINSISNSIKMYYEDHSEVFDFEDKDGVNYTIKPFFNRGRIKEMLEIDNMFLELFLDLSEKVRVEMEKITKDKGLSPSEEINIEIYLDNKTKRDFKKIFMEFFYFCIFCFISELSFKKKIFILIQTAWSSNCGKWERICL